MREGPLGVSRTRRRRFRLSNSNVGWNAWLVATAGEKPCRKVKIVAQVSWLECEREGCSLGGDDAETPWAVGVSRFDRVL